MIQMTRKSLKGVNSMKEKFKFKYNKKHLLYGIVIGIMVFTAFMMSTMQAFGIPAWKNTFKAFGVADFSAQADEYPMAVHVIDVGKADSIFITCEGKNILIDAGETDIYKVVNEYLRKLGVKTIDLLVLTHQHSDHVGSMSSVVDEFDVKSCTMPFLKEEMIPTFTSYEKLLESLDKKDIKIDRPVPGTSYNIGEMRIDILAPHEQYDDMNSNSIVMKITYKDKSFLFTGDAGEESEKDMIASEMDLKADVLKVGHHGSKTATSQEFLDKVRPVYAVISVGEDRNKLPKKVTTDRLKENNIKTYRTDLDGTVIFATDGDNMKILCENGDDK